MNDNDKYISANAALSAALAERLTTNTTTATSSGVRDESSYATSNNSPSLSNAAGHNNFSHTGNHNAISNTHASSTADTFLSGNASHTMMPNMNNAHDSLYAVDNNSNNNYVNVNTDMEDDRRLPMHFPARMQ